MLCIAALFILLKSGIVTFYTTRMSQSTVINNRKVHFNFELLDSYEAGISLYGHEVKSLRNGRGKLDGSYISIRDGEAWLMGANIPPYQVANTPDSYKPGRPRKLLLSRREIDALDKKSFADRLTIVPIKLYNNNGKIKLKIALARGKKKADKRETIKARDTKRDIARTLKEQY